MRWKIWHILICTIVVHPIFAHETINEYNLNLSVGENTLYVNIEDWSNTNDFKIILDTTNYEDIDSSANYLNNSSTTNTLNTITHYEYWYDHNINNRVSVSITPTSDLDLQVNLPTNNLTTGLHTVNIRFKDSGNGASGKVLYSGTVTQLFQKMPTYTTNHKKITEYEYWFDDDYVNKVTVDIADVTNYEMNTNIDISSVTEGLHQYHIRFKDDSGLWSGTTSQLFQRKKTFSGNTNKIVAYEYWFDDDYGNKTTINITSTNEYELNADIDASFLTEGLHQYHVRFKDDSGLWSGTTSQLFQKKRTFTGNTNKIVVYEYWFDDNYSSKTSINITPINEYELNTNLNVAFLSGGLHQYHVRFKDDSGLWSETVSQLFYKRGDNTASPNLIVGYRYWFDTNIANATNVSLVTPINPYEMIMDIDASSLTNGSHVFNIQYQDSLGLWSPVVSQTFNKLPVVIAAFNANTTAFCGTSGTTIFNNTSTNADNYLWNFGDGTTSTLQTPTHTFNGVGSYNVTLIITNNTYNFSDTIVQTNYINVSQVTPTISSDQTICVGNSATLTVGGGTSYNWQSTDGSLNATNTANVIASPTTTTNYPVIVTNSFGCTGTASVNVLVNDEPTLQTAQSVATNCQGDSAILYLSGGNTYNIFPMNNVSLINDSTYYLHPNTTQSFTTIAINGCGADTSSITQTVISNSSSSVNAVICANESILLGGILQTQAGTYYDTLIAYTGCDSVITTQLSVNAIPSVANSSVQQIDCFGQNTGAISLTASSGSGSYTYSWSHDNTLNSSSITNLAPNTYTVTITDGNQCNYSQNFTVAAPSIVISTNNNATICQGDSVYLEGNYQYLANTYYDTLTSYLGCDSVLITQLAVNPLPSITSSSVQQIECFGAQTGVINLTGISGAGNYIYSWSHDNTLNSFSATNLVAATYTVTITDGNQCNFSQSFTITAPTTSITTNSSVAICQGDSIYLEGSYQYLANTYNDTLISYLGCDSVVNTQLTVNALPPIPVISQINANTFESSLANTYQWYLDSIPINNATSQSYTATQSGIYQVEVSIANCFNISDTVIFIAVSNQDIVINDYEVKVFPNPNNGRFNLSLSHLSGQEVVIDIYNKIGQKLYSEHQGNLFGETNIPIQMDELAAGMYLLQVIIDGKVGLMKILVY